MAFNFEVDEINKSLTVNVPVGFTVWIYPVGGAVSSTGGGLNVVNGVNVHPQVDEINKTVTINVPAGLTVKVNPIGGAEPSTGGAVNVVYQPNVNPQVKVEQVKEETP